jgi:hypothetical protein
MATVTILDCFTPRARIGDHEKDRDPASADNPLKKPSNA